MNDLDDDLKLDLTPMIDVIFMLIIFFIMTMSFVMPVINVDLPTSSTANTEAQKTSLVVAISKNGELSYQGEMTTKDKLETILKDGKYQEIVVHSDKDAPVQAMVDVADLSREYVKGELRLVVNKQ
ncbi:MAG: biopolymer transporter ExbD [Succinatimonas sp.]|jgi:biopolymer transport protein ExbD|nr:biopolymer transporter ExbD [Succinatimonas sp.]MDD5868233.1 biopolymer transporter ExbD [Succinatimonas sp.]MDY5721470.1 biopolymer transporter ExbD [Succinivibrio sp.]